MAAGDVITIREDASGKKGNYFDGTDDYVLHDAHAVARVAANDTVGTYTAWVYVNDTDSNHTILSAGDNNSATEYMSVSTGSDARLYFKLYHGGAMQFQVRSTDALSIARKWTHVAVVQNGTQPAIYINGEAVDTTNDTATDLTFWYDELTGCDKFAIGVLESNATHTADWKGAIGQVKYWNLALNAVEIKTEADGGTHAQGTARNALLNAPAFNVTMEDDGTTDSGSGADNGTLTGNAHYGGEISTWSIAVERNSTGHAAEFINTFRDVDKFVSVIKRGD